MDNLAHFALQLFSAYKNGKAIPQLTKQFPALSLTEAYEIQACQKELFLNERDPIVGYKMGLTSKAKQKDVGVFETIRGFLTQSMEISKNGEMEFIKRIHPRVEPELAVVVDQTITDERITLRNIKEYVSGIYPALEVVDSRYENFVFSLPDVIADNTSASHFMLGGCNLLGQWSELGLLGVNVRKNGELVQTGCAAAVLGDPILSLMELITQMQKQKTPIEAGTVILTGGITQSIPVSLGDFVEMEWEQEKITINAI